MTIERNFRLTQEEWDAVLNLGIFYDATTYGDLTVQDLRSKPGMTDGGYLLPAYALLDSMITDTTSMGIDSPRIRIDGDVEERVDPAVWIWIRGAAGVNSPPGTPESTYFGKFIRQYTAEQYFLRKNEELYEVEMNFASNSVAHFVLADIERGFKNDSGLPDIRTIGQSDAAAATKFALDIPLSAWAGAILFPYLSVNFTRDMILLREDRTENGTYDLFAAAYSSQEAMKQIGLPSPADLSALLSTISGTGAAFLPNTGLVAQIEGEVDAFFLNKYGVMPTGSVGAELFRPDLPGDGLNFIVGKLDQANALEGTSKSDMIRGGQRDDVIKGSFGADIIDAGERVEIINTEGPAPDREASRTLDFDTLDYSGAGGRIFVTLDGNTVENGERLKIQVGASASSTQYAFNIEKIVSGSLNDVIRITKGHLENLIHIDTGGGDDYIEIGSGVENRSGALGKPFVIDAGDGNDTIAGAPNFSVIYGGSGEDLFILSNNTLIADAEAHDQLWLYEGEIWVRSALRNQASESPWAIGGFGLFKASINFQGDLVVKDIKGREMYVSDYVGGPGTAFEDSTLGIFIGERSVARYRLLDPNLPQNWFETYIEAIGTMVKLGYYNLGVEGVDPLVIDLDGDGIELSSLSANVMRFDVDGDGFAERTGWVRGDDGLLALDANGDGLINDVSELFGGPNQPGFAELASLDSNLDGVINALDAAFAQLRIWRDIDGDGVTDAGELQTLAAHGIASLSLASAPGNSFISGNQVAALGQATLTDGSTRTVGEIWFKVSNWESTWLGSTATSPTAADLPDIKGHGTLTDLQVAMGMSPALEAVVRTTLPSLDTPDLAELRAAAAPILGAWAQALPLPGVGVRSDVALAIKPGTGDISIDVVAFGIRHVDELGEYWTLSTGAVVLDEDGVAIARPTLDDILAQPPGTDAAWTVLTGEEVAFLERYYGEPLPLGEAPEPGTSIATLRAAMSGLLEVAYERLNLMALRLASEGPLGELMEGVRYDKVSDQFVMTTDQQLAPMFRALLELMPSDAGDATAFLDDWRPLIRTLLGDLDRGQGLEKTFGWITQNITAAYGDLTEPSALSITDIAEHLGVVEDLVIHTPGALVEGTADIDIIVLNQGDQTAQGGAGSDSYIIGRGAGEVVISDLEAIGGASSSKGLDKLFLAGFNSDDVVMWRDNNDLLIEDASTGLSIRLLEQFNRGFQYGVFSGELNEWRVGGVDEIIFQNGQIWDRVDVAKAVSRPSAGDETLQGTRDIDVLDGGTGNDSLMGDRSSDIYRFGIGYGQDTIHDFEAGHENYTSSLTPDFLEFGAGISWNDLTLTRSGDDLFITLQNVTDTLLIKEFFRWNPYIFVVPEHTWGRIEVFSFIDGTDVSWRDLVEEAQKNQTTEGNDTVLGITWGESSLAGGAGDDRLISVEDGYFLAISTTWGGPVSFADTFDGGAGDDTMQGGVSDDLYMYSRGMDEIIDADGLDTLLFADNISPDDVHFILAQPGGNDLTVVIGADGDQIIIRNQIGEILNLWNNFAPAKTIDFFKFSDGTIWSYADVFAGLWSGSSASDVLNGDTEGNRITGQEGNDWIDGRAGNDTLTGGVGDDSLDGGLGQDTFSYTRGDGHDRIVDGAYGSSADHLVFGAGINPADITLVRNGGDVTLVIAESNPGAGDGGSVLLVLALDDDNERGVEQVAFANGTTWSRATIRQMLLEQVTTDGSDTITAFVAADALSGGTGDDSLIGLGGDDTFTGGVGNDSLDGGLGQDTFLYARGDGHDRIVDGVFGGSGDKLVLGSGINPADITLVRNGSDVTLVIAESSPGAGDGGSILLVLALDDYYDRGVDQVAFADGTTWSRANMRQMLLEQATTAGNDTIVGLYSPDVLVGGGGNDSLSGADDNDTFTGGVGNDSLDGGSGLDTFLYARGDGHDQIVDGTNGSSGDQLVFGTGINPADITLVRNGSDVTLVIAETSPGAGDGGSVLLVLALDDYFDRGVDQVAFADGTVWSRAYLRQVLLTQASLGGDDTVVGLNSADVLWGGAGNDSLSGVGGNDMLTGGVGNDSLDGGYGQDTFLYSRGDGHDRIVDGTDGSSGDQLVFGTGINPADITLVRNGSDVTLVIAESSPGAGDGGSVLLVLTLDDYYDRGVDQVAFADGTTWSRATIRQMILEQAATSGSDTIVGLYSSDALFGGGGNDSLSGIDGNDTFTGGVGNDSLDGGYGQDTFLYSRGDGHDRIVDGAGGSGADQLVFVSGINPADITLVRNGSDVTLVIAESSPGAGDGGSVLLAEALDDYYDRGVDQVAFADGTTWSRATIRQMILEQAATSGSDTIVGLYSSDALVGGGGNDSLSGIDGNDTFTGGVGNDSLDGGYGQDTFLYSRGDGHDRIVDGAGGSSGDQLVFGTGINPADITLVRNGSDVTLVIAESSPGAGDGGSVLLVEALDDYYDRGIDQVAFVNGTTWSRATIRQMVLEQAATSGSDTIVGLYSSDALAGGAGNDSLSGVEGNDTLTGGAGNDSLSGGGGADRFVWLDALEGGDVVADFSVVDDQLLFLASGFGGGLNAGALSAGRFALDAATTTQGQFIYNAGNGQLLWDVDGTGAEESVLIATLTTKPAITAADLEILA